MPNKVTVVGLKEANRALKRLPTHVKVDTQQAFDVTAYNVASDAASSAPTSSGGSHQRPAGFLKASISWTSRPRSFAAVVRIAKAAFYWQFVEFGTRFMSARPFLRSAADKNRDDHRRRVAQAMVRSARKMAAEGKARG